MLSQNHDQPLTEIRNTSLIMHMSNPLWWWWHYECNVVMFSMTSRQSLVSRSESTGFSFIPKSLAIEQRNLNTLWERYYYRPHRITIALLPSTEPFRRMSYWPRLLYYITLSRYHQKNFVISLFISSNSNTFLTFTTFTLTKLTLWVEERVFESWERKMRKCFRWVQIWNKFNAWIEPISCLSLANRRAEPPS